MEYLIQYLSRFSHLSNFTVYISSQILLIFFFDFLENAFILKSGFISPRLNSDTDGNAVDLSINFSS